MAQLNDTMVQGDLRVTGTIYGISLDGKADKVTPSTGVQGHLASLDYTGNLSDSGISAYNVSTALTALGGKADKDNNAVEGNVAVFDDSGNPVDSNNTIGARLTLQKPLNQVITGTGIAAVTTSPYYPARWKFNLGMANPTAGDRLVIKIPCAGHDNGCFISTDNGTTYYPVARHTGATRLTTHYPNGAYICVVFEAYVSGVTGSGTVADVYPPTGGTAKTTYTNGCWRVINDYDANSTYSGFVCGYCNTGASTATKSVTATNYTAQSGHVILVWFTTKNSAAGVLKMTAGGVTADIKWNGTATAAGTTSAIPAGTWPCYYDGTNWNIWTDGHTPYNVQPVIGHSTDQWRELEFPLVGIYGDQMRYSMDWNASTGATTTPNIFFKSGYSRGCLCAGEFGPVDLYRANKSSVYWSFRTNEEQTLYLNADHSRYSGYIFQVRPTGSPCQFSVSGSTYSNYLYCNACAAMAYHASDANNAYRADSAYVADSLLDSASDGTQILGGIDGDGPGLILQTGTSIAQKNVELRSSYIYFSSTSGSSELNAGALLLNGSESYVKVGPGRYMRAYTVGSGADEEAIIDFTNKPNTSQTPIPIRASRFIGDVEGTATGAVVALSATSATKATKDGDGNVITSTYATIANTLQILTDSTSPATFDYDNAKDRGIHFINASNSLYNNGGPYSGNLILFVLPNKTKTRVFQITVGSTDMICFRRYNDDGWQAWKRVKWE